LVQEIAKMFLN